MDKYNEIKEKIEKKYLSGNEELTDGRISILELVDILNEIFKPLKDIERNENFKRIINGNIGIPSKIKRALNRKKATILDKDCEIIVSQFKDNTSSIILFFNDINEQYGARTLTVTKMVDNDELSIDSDDKDDKEFVSKYIGELLSVFATLEEFAPLFNGEISVRVDGVRQEFDDGILRVGITCHSNGYIAIKILSSSCDPDDIYFKSWLNREMLSTYVFNRREEILRNYIISIDEINEPLRGIVIAYLESKDCKKLKK